MHNQFKDLKYYFYVGIATCSFICVDEKLQATMNFCSSGIALYVEGTGLIQNNSIIRTGSISKLQCISASNTPNIGEMVAPNGDDITSDSTMVTVGGSADPSYLTLDLQTNASFIRSNQGVYTCIIPDKNDDMQYLHVGVYYSGFNSM